MDWNFIYALLILLAGLVLGTVIITYLNVWVGIVFIALCVNAMFLFAGRD